MIKRREFIEGAIAGLGLVALRCAPAPAKPLFRISLAEWSLHRSIMAGTVNHLDFAAIAKRQFGIDGIEYVNQFFFDKAEDRTFLSDMKNRAADEGVKSLLIMCDNEGRLGDPDAALRQQAVENHYKWVTAARFLGCHSIRVNAFSQGSYQEQQRLVAEGLHRLCEFSHDHDINIIVENHGGFSSNGKWLAEVMTMVNHVRIGTLPDFGNFQLNADEWYDRYRGVQEMMPFAKGVSAKTHEFDAHGQDIRTDYEKMLKIVLDAGYRGYIGIEYEGAQLEEMAGIRATQKLLEQARNRLAPLYES